MGSSASSISQDKINDQPEINPERFNVVYPNESDTQTLAPLILLDDNDEVKSFKNCLKDAYGAEWNQSYYFALYPTAQQSYHNFDNKYGLTQDQFFAIYFYTLEWKRNKALNTYSRLNTDLTCPERDDKARKWRFYLYYLFSALRRLPKWPGSPDIYRVVHGNLAQMYPEKYKQGKKVTWYAFTSASTDKNTANGFFDKKQPNNNTLFTLSGVFSGRLIQAISSLPQEAEVLLPPGSTFEVISVNLAVFGVHIVLSQIPTTEKDLDME